MFKNKKVIIFDMDGTLIDSVGIWNQVDIALLSRICPDVDVSAQDTQLLRDHALRDFSKSHNPYLDYCEMLGKMYCSDLRAEDIYALRYEIALEYLRNVVDYKENADCFVRKLKSEGYTLVIASTTKRANIEIYRTLNTNIRSKANIDDYFTAVYTREDVTEIKPHPEVYLRVLYDLNVSANECIVFEDSLVGIEASKAAGITTVAVYDSHSDKERDIINNICDYHIASYSEVM